MRNSNLTTALSAPRPGRSPIGEAEAAGYVQIALGVTSIALHIPPREILSPSRRPRVAFARQVAIYLAHVVFRLNLTCVGRAFGRDRTTASYACHVIEDRRDDPAVEALVSACEDALVLLPKALMIAASER